MDNKKLNKAVGEKIRSYRRKTGYSQEKLAELTDLSPQHVQRLEGKKPSGVTLFTLLKLAAVFQVPLCVFLEGITNDKKCRVHDSRKYH